MSTLENGKTTSRSNSNSNGRGNGQNSSQNRLGSCSNVASGCSVKRENTIKGISCNSNGNSRKRSESSCGGTSNIRQSGPSLISPIVRIVDGHPTTLSTQVAEFFGKRHDAVLRDIRNLLKKAPELRLHNFVETQQLVKVGAVERQIVVYRMDRKGFTLLAMGFTGKVALDFKIAYIDEFDRMEAELQKQKQLAFPAHETINAEQQYEICKAVATRAKKESAHYQTIYRAIKNRFKIAKYDQLPAERFKECLIFIDSVELKAPEIPELIEEKAVAVTTQPVLQQRYAVINKGEVIVWKDSIMKLLNEGADG